MGKFETLQLSILVIKLIDWAIKNSKKRVQRARCEFELRGWWWAGKDRPSMESLSH